MYYKLYPKDCLSLLGHVAPASIDAVVTDPIYPEISREYGRITEAEWLSLMSSLLEKLRVVLKPQGSAVFVIQPNSSTAGSLRFWPYQFILQCKDAGWNLIQDAYWFNYCCMPTASAKRTVGLLRPAVKWLVWLGPPNCYRNQDEILWTPADSTRAISLDDRSRRTYPSGHTMNRARLAEIVQERGGVTPMNLFPDSNTSSHNHSGHPAATPLSLCSKWVRYLCPKGGTVLDPFAGSGTVGIAAAEHGCNYIGYEKNAKYIAMATERLEKAFNTHVASDIFQNSPEGRAA